MSDHELIVSYLLGELDPEAAAALERRLDSEPELRREVDSLRPVVVELERAPEEAWTAATELPPAPQLPPAAEPAPKPRRAWRRPALAAAAAVAVLAIGIGIGTQLDGDSEAPSQTLVLRALPDGGQAKGSVRVDADGPGTAEVVIDDLPERPGHHYELWLLSAEGDPVSLGTVAIDPGGHTDTVIRLPVDPSSYESFDVSVEPDDGDPSHSGDSVLRGPATAS